jgi:anthranilate phosphoribosyltransferase
MVPIPQYTQKRCCAKATVWIFQRYVVHGSDGLDEITTSGPTAVAALENGTVRSFEIAPENVGMARVKPEALRGGDAETTAAALQGVLEGRKGPYRDVAVLNATAALVVAAKAKTLADGVRIAQHAIDAGEAEGCLDRLIAFGARLPIPRDLHAI